MSERNSIQPVCSLLVSPHSQDVERSLQPCGKINASPPVPIRLPVCSEGGHPAAGGGADQSPGGSARRNRPPSPPPGLQTRHTAHRDTLCYHTNRTQTQKPSTLNQSSNLSPRI